MLTNKPNLKAITFPLKAPSITIVHIFTINVDSEQVSYTYNDRTTDHIEYTGGEGIQRAGSKHQYATR